MRLVLALSLCAAAASAAPAPKPAKSAPSRTAGKILQSQVKIAPGADGPVMREGRLTMLDKAGHTEEFKVTPKTRVTLDGKAAKYEKASAPGTLVLKALYDPSTKELASLDLKSVPRDSDDPKTAAGPARGEIANTDIVKNTISVREGRAVRDYAVTDSTKILREAEGKPGEETTLDALKVGESVEIHSADGKTALEIHARAAK